MPRIITTGFVRRMERRNVTIRIFGKIGSRRNLAMEATIIAFLALRTVTMIGLTMVIECVCCLVCEVVLFLRSIGVVMVYLTYGLQMSYT